MVSSSDPAITGAVSDFVSTAARALQFDQAQSNQLSNNGLSSVAANLFQVCSINGLVVRDVGQHFQALRRQPNLPGAVAEDLHADFSEFFTQFQSETAFMQPNFVGAVFFAVAFVQLIDQAHGDSRFGILANQ